MADTDITITNGALARLGQSSIADFTTDNKSVICGAIYPKYINALLSMYPWRFARKKSGFLTQTTVPDNAFTLAYLVPADFLTLVHVYNSGDASARPIVAGYEIFGNNILTNETELYIDYNSTVDEDDWPDWFQNFAMSALASVLAIPITEDDNKENFYRQLTFGPPSLNGEGGIYKQAKGIDSRNQPHRPFRGQSLLAARFK